MNKITDLFCHFILFNQKRWVWEYVSIQLTVHCRVAYQLLLLLQRFRQIVPLYPLLRKILQRHL